MNRLEAVSILCAGTTIYCGLLYFTEDLEETSKMMLFAIMLLANLLFFSFWITGLSEALAIKCAEMMPRVANCFCRCYLKNYNFRVLVASMGINLKTHPGIPLQVHPDHKTMDELSVLQKTSKFDTTVPSGLTLPSKQASKPVIDISLSY